MYLGWTPLQVGEVNTDLSKRQNLHDRDEIEAEQQERLLKKKLTEAFKNFYKKVRALVLVDYCLSVPG